MRLRGVLARVLGWTACVALAAWAGVLDRRPPARGGVAVRLAEPFAALAASVEWIRFDAALDAGRAATAYARAERALSLAPRASEGWLYLAGHLAFERASVEAESDPARRRAWIRAALDLLERGEESAGEPGRLALERGLILVAAGDRPELGWPGGAAAARTEARAAFQRAAALGLPIAAELAGALEQAGGAPLGEDGAPARPPAPDDRR
jgi:hypothetical protein